MPGGWQRLEDDLRFGCLRHRDLGSRALGALRAAGCGHRDGAAAERQLYPGALCGGVAAWQVTHGLGLADGYDSVVGY